MWDYPQATWHRYQRARIPFTVEWTRQNVGALVLPELREHARVSDTSQDAILTRFANAAGRRLEDDTRRILLTTTVQEHYDVWPWDYLGTVHLHFHPVASVTHVKYYDPDNVQQTWDSAQYDTDLVNEPARIVVAEGATLTSPSVDQRLNAVTLTYVAGYGTTLDDLPDAAVIAICQYATFLYDQQRDLSPAHDLASVERIWQAAIRELVWTAH